RKSVTRRGGKLACAAGAGRCAHSPAFSAGCAPSRQGGPSAEVPAPGAAGGRATRSLSCEPEMRHFAAFLLVLMLSRAAAAHISSSGFLVLRIEGGEVSGSLELALRDA